MISRARSTTWIVATVLWLTPGWLAAGCAREASHATSSEATSGGEGFYEGSGGVQVEMDAARSGAPAPAPPAMRAPTADEMFALNGKAKGKLDAFSPDAEPGTAHAGGGSAALATDAKDARKPALIYDARVHLAVFESSPALDAAEAIAQKAGGYLVHRSDRSITFRVPAAEFQDALLATMKLGDVLHREVSVRDVTEELTDLRARLRNAESVRARLEQLLARASNVKEALEVEQELSRVTREIEQLKGRLALLDELLAFSTITLSFAPRPVEHVDPQVRLPFPWLDELRLTELLSL